MEELQDHGDRQVPAGALDLAVNVLGSPPGWLMDELRRVDVAGYPDPAAALGAIAARHGVAREECLVLNGAAEAFSLVAEALRPRLAACIHPSFTAPEAALRAARVPVHRVLREPGTDFALDPRSVPEQADLVVLGRPDNPTGRVEPLDVVTALLRPGRVVVVDEAFADFLPDAGSVHDEGLPGVICVRSLTKLWGLAGLRIGYLLAGPDVVARLDAVRQPWPVNALALHAATRLVPAEAERRRRVELVAAAREELLADLAALPLRAWSSPANYLLLRSAVDDLRARLLRHDVAVRRGETFPGLDPSFVRVAVPVEPSARARLVTALRDSLAGVEAPGDEPLRSSQADAAPAAVGRTLVLGGARSGKSRHSQHLLAGHRDVLYVAPGPVPNEEDRDWAERVAAHRRHRPSTWTTLESTDVAAALRETERPVLVDCLATWLASVMSEAGAWESGDGDTDWQKRLEVEVDRLLEAWRSARVPVVAVTNEVGSGVVPGTRSGVLFRDALGRLNQRLADEADEVHLVVAGRVQRLPGSTP
jgi:histidinol-phosphate/aromatic aminotransferase/cobyric acid decarboxylase-like protein/adenosyl cobinamide kinase/adenosyl cobinamide phosphate guanylyltransferase